MENFQKFWFVVWIILELIAIIVGVIGNCVVVLVMTREKWLKNKTSFYNRSIALANLLSSIFIIAMTTMRSIVLWDNTADINFTACTWLTSILFGLSTTSEFQLVFVSIDRYWAVSYPVSHRHRKAILLKVVVAFCWAAGMSIGITPLMESHSSANCSPRFIFFWLHVIIGFSCLVAVGILYSLTFKKILEKV